MHFYFTMIFVFFSITKNLQIPIIRLKNADFLQRYLIIMPYYAAFRNSRPAYIAAIRTTLFIFLCVYDQRNNFSFFYIHQSLISQLQCRAYR